MIISVEPKRGRPRKEGPRDKKGHLLNKKGGQVGRPRTPFLMALPEKTLIFDQVLYWIDLQATQEEIAGSFHISVESLNNRLLEYFGFNFSELKKRCNGNGKLSLRRYQFKQSEHNASMAIWLGKQWLGQKDNHEDNQAPNHELVSMLLSQIMDLKGKIKEIEQAAEQIYHDDRNETKTND